MGVEFDPAAHGSGKPSVDEMASLSRLENDTRPAIQNTVTGEWFYIDYEKDLLVSGRDSENKLELPKAAIVLLQVGSQWIEGRDQLIAYLDRKGIDIG